MPWTASTMYTLPSLEPARMKLPLWLTAGEEEMGPPVVKFQTLLPGMGVGREKEVSQDGEV